MAGEGRAPMNLEVLLSKKTKPKKVNNKFVKTHGLSKIETYRIWVGMVMRCHNPNSKPYSGYGAVGISVCQEWRDSFWAFMDYMGDRPPRKVIDRIDTTGNYEPGNVRWSTLAENGCNSMRSLWWIICGVWYPSQRAASTLLKKPMVEIARVCGKGRDENGGRIPASPGCRTEYKYPKEVWIQRDTENGDTQ